MSKQLTLEQEKSNFNSLINSKIGSFKQYLSQIEKTSFNKSDVESEMFSNQTFLNKYIHKNFPIKESKFIDGQEYFYKSTAVNSILNLILSQRYNEFEELYRQFLKGL